MGVTADVDAIVDAVAFREEGPERWLELRSDDPLHAVEAAVDRANGLDSPSGEEPQDALGGFVAPTVAGTGVEVTHCDDPTLVRGWVERLLRSLEAAGCSGHLVLVDQLSLPGDDLPSVVPTAFLAWRLARPFVPRDDWRSHWGVDDDLTVAAMRRSASWCLELGGEVTIEVGGGPPSTVSGDAEVEHAVRLLVDGIGESRFVDVSATRGEQVRRVGFGMGAMSVVQQLGDDGSESALHELRRVLVGDAPDLRWGGIRLAHAGHCDISALHGVTDLPGGLTGGTQVGRAGVLLEELVPDVCGIQVIGGRHLDRLSLSPDLWRTTEVAPDRYCVESVDLRPWFAGPHVPRDTLERHRVDFAPLQLTASGLWAARQAAPLI